MPAISILEERLQRTCVHVSNQRRELDETQMSPKDRREREEHLRLVEAYAATIHRRLDRMKNHVDPRIAPLDEREAILAEAKTAIEHKLAEVRKVGGAATRAEDELLREAIDYIDAGPPEMIRTAIAELLQPLMDERGMFRGLTETRRRLAELKRERAELLSAIEDDLLAVERAISGATSVTA